MKDSDRLKLLKDVAGTNTYETRRAESVQVMKETEYKKEQIEERLEKINDQLNELEERRQELKIYNEKDREKKALEYAMNYKEQVEAQGKLEDLTAKKNRENEKINELTTAFNNGDKELEVSYSFIELVAPLTDVPFIRNTKDIGEEDRRAAGERGNAQSSHGELS